MTEPSKEAVEAGLRASHLTMTDFARDRFRGELQAALPIERERWEREIRERLEIEIERHKAAGKSANFPRPHWDRAETLEVARDSIFKEDDDA